MDFRARHTKVLIGGLALLILARLTYLQLYSDEYAAFSSRNFLRLEILYPFRGEVFARDGKVLATNRQSFRLMVIPSFYHVPYLDSILSILHLTHREWLLRLQKARSYSRILPSEMVRAISDEEAARLAPWLAHGQGLYLESYWQRHYPHAAASHILGYLSEVPPSLLRKDSFYIRGDVYGVRGIERFYERRLRGIKGRRKIITDVYGRVVGVYPDASFNREPRAGLPLLLTIDQSLQEYATRLLKGKRGSLVALDPRGGEVLAMVSVPGYIADSMTCRRRYSYFRRLIADSSAPLFNRAITASYPPGSTIKPLLALIGLQQGVITPAWKVSCRYGYYSKGLHVGCHGHPSPLAVKDAIRHSCNAFFVALFLESMERLDTTPDRAYVRWRDHLMDFGLGRLTGIDLPNERGGYLPDTGYFNHFYGVGQWKGSTIASLGIGQGELLMTPLQMAWVAALLASRGKCPPPHLNQELFVLPNDVSQRYADTTAWEIVQAGMKEVVRRGTARWVRTNRFDMAGKTGTAENPHGRDHSLFIGFAPADSPRIAVAVVIENGGFGASIAAPIASLVMEKYLFDSVERPTLERYCIEYGKPLESARE